MARPPDAPSIPVRQSRRWLWGAPALLFALYVAGPHLEFNWNDAAPSIPARYSCPAGYTLALVGTFDPICDRPGVATLKPTLEAAAIDAKPERRRVGLYLVGITPVRVFDLDFAGGRFEGFGLVRPPR